MSVPRYRTVPYEDLLTQLGSAAPTPGGGSAAALAGAMGAAAVAMLARLTRERPRYDKHRDLMDAVAEGADETRDRLLDLANEDAAAYEAVLEAYRCPQETDEEKEARAAAIQEALVGAIEVPLNVMEQCLEVIGLAKNAIESGFKAAVTDGAAGAELARAALKIASWNVRANLGEVEDERYAKDTRTRLDEMMFMGTKVATGLDSIVNELTAPS